MTTLKTITGDESPVRDGRGPEQAREFARLVETAERGTDGGYAACRLGDLYRKGKGGLRHSPRQARRWYARSALAGDPNGQNNLGACFEHGVGGPQSYRAAVHWYRKSAAQRLDYAAGNLGWCYLAGHGVPEDSAMALEWFEKAIEFGDARAVTREWVETLRAWVAQSSHAARATASARPTSTAPEVEFVDLTEQMLGTSVVILGVRGAGARFGTDAERQKTSKGSEKER